MKKYCTQNNAQCESCSLSNYGRDCRNNPVSPKKSRNFRLSDEIMRQLRVLAGERSVTSYLETLVEKEYKTMEVRKMKKVTLVHDDLKGFMLVDDVGDFVTTVDVGEEEDPDWDLIEKQANKKGYTLD